MEVATQIGAISEEELSQLLRQRRNIQRRFRWNATDSDAVKILTAAYRAEVEGRACTFKMDDNVKQAIAKVAKSLTAEHPRLGMMLCGTCGNGKTTMLRAIQNATSQLREWKMIDEPAPLEIIDAREMAELSKDVINMNHYKSTPLLAIEDMGKESAEVLNYGNAINPVMEVIEGRYAKQKYTLITTNITGKQVREKYGDRIADRFNEMLNVIVFADGSYRK